MHSRDDFWLISCIGTLWDDIRSATRSSTVLRRCKVLLDAIMKSPLRCSVQDSAPQFSKLMGRWRVEFGQGRACPAQRTLDGTGRVLTLARAGRASWGRPPSPSGGEDLLVLGRARGKSTDWLSNSDIDPLHGSQLMVCVLNLQVIVRKIHIRIKDCSFE